MDILLLHTSLRTSEHLSMILPGAARPHIDIDVNEIPMKTDFNHFHRCTNIKKDSHRIIRATERCHAETCGDQLLDGLERERVLSSFMRTCSHISTAHANMPCYAVRHGFLAHAHFAARCHAVADRVKTWTRMSHSLRQGC